MEVKKIGRPAKTDKTEVQIEQSPERVEGTRPGWKPASVLPNLKAPAGFTARWVANDPGNVAKKMAEGWVLMEPKDNKGIKIRTTDVMAGNQMASEIRYRDSIAMMLPNESKAGRDEYMRKLNSEAVMSSLKETDAEFKKKGVQTYAPKGQAGRIVIE